MNAFPNTGAALLLLGHCYVWLSFCSLFVFDLFCFIKSYFGILFTEYNVNNEIRGHDFKREHREVYGSIWGDKKEGNDVFITISQKYNRWLKKEKKEWIYDHNNILKKIIQGKLKTITILHGSDLGKHVLHLHSSRMTFPPAPPPSLLYIRVQMWPIALGHH